MLSDNPHPPSADVRTSGCLPYAIRLIQSSGTLQFEVQMPPESRIDLSDLFSATSLGSLVTLKEWRFTEITELTSFRRDG